MGNLVQDVRFGMRILAKSPAFAAVAVGTLALGIGANTAIFSVVNAVLLRPLPYAQPDHLVMVWELWQGGVDDLAPADFLDLNRQNHVFEAMSAFKKASFNMTGGERPEQIDGAIVSANLFFLLGVKPRLGRGFLSEDGQPGAPRVVMLSDSLWQGRFGGNPAILGQKLILNGGTYIVVGIMPPGFQFPGEAELWVAPRFVVPEHPLRPNEDPRAMRGSHYFDTIARLKPGVTLAQAQADLETVVRRIAREHPDSEAGNGVRLTTLRDETVGDVRAALLILLGAVGLVLLIACANVANLQLARATVRRKEMAVRSALGASRLRVFRQLLTESMLLSIVGGGLGVFFAVWGFGPLVSLVPQEVRGIAHLTLDRRVFAFTLILSVITGLIFGLMPALQSSQIDLNADLKEGGRNPSEGHRGRARNLLVMGEIALAMVLLSGAGLLVKSFLRLQAVDHGFDPQNVLTMGISLAPPSYSEASKRASFVEQIIERIERLPGVRSAAVVARLPLNPGSSARSITIEGRVSSPGENLSPDYNVASPDYFATLSIPLLEGRHFGESDTANGQPVVIINRTMARLYWPGQDAVSKRLKIGDDKNWREIVGIVGDVKQHALSEPSRPMMYVPYAQDAWPSLTLAIRTAADPAASTALVRREIQAVDRDEPTYNVQTMDQVVSASVSPRRFNTLLLGLFAAFALILAGVGIYGVISYSVSQRTHEIGVRMALGAGRRDVLRLVVGHGMLLAAGGLAAGLVAALGLTRFLSSLLYGVRPADPATLIAVSCILAGVAFAATYLPARRATKADPMLALRSE